MKCIAIVDDNEVTSQLLARLLRQAGYIAICVPGGGEAMEHLRLMTPDLLVLDVMMPQVSGLDLLRSLRDDPQFTELPVIMLSGVMDVNVQAEACRLGALDFIIKGWDWDRLLDRIEQYVPKEQGV